MCPKNNGTLVTSIPPSGGEKPTDGDSGGEREREEGGGGEKE